MLTAIRVSEQSQVAEARREALAQANRLGFDEEDAGRVALVATELATNLVKHVRGGGEILAGIYDDTSGTGVELFPRQGKGDGQHHPERAGRLLDRWELRHRPWSGH